MVDELNGQDTPAVRTVADRSTDPATQSLADALRVSFKLLRLIMLAVVAAFLATGIGSIEEQQVGVLKVFGKVVGTAKAGFVYNWPFPIGSIELVDTREQTINLKEFWMDIDPKYRHVDISEVPIPKQGLRPGRDGALLSGDRSLIHVKLSCTFAVREPIPYIKYVTDLDETMRSVVCAAAIQTAAARTADSIWSDPLTFANEIQREAQRRLDALLNVQPGEPKAIQINAIVVDNRTWPLRARPAYEAAQRASQEKQQIIDEAIADAKRILSEAAGASYEQLVGRPWEISTADGDQPKGLIAQYDQAKAAGDEQRAEQILRQIDSLLLSRNTGGQASKIIAEATAYKTTLIEAVRGRVERFRQLLPEFEKDPQFLLNRLWAAAREDILSAPTVEKYFITVGPGGTVLRINRDPEVVKQLLREKIKAQQEAEQGGGD